MRKWWKLWAPLALLVLLTPIGLWLPRLFGASGAWGEWSMREIKGITGYIPQKMRGLGGLWRAPAQNYGIAGAREDLGYLASAAIGVIIIVAAGFAAGRALLRDGKRKNKDK